MDKHGFETTKISWRWFLKKAVYKLDPKWEMVTQQTQTNKLITASKSSYVCGKCTQVFHSNDSVNRYLECKLESYQ